MACASNVSVGRTSMMKKPIGLQASTYVTASALLAACGAPARPAAQPDTNATVTPFPPADAAIALGDVSAPPLTLEAATPDEKQCRNSDAADIDHERGRERAALDQALRAQGFTPLVAAFDRRYTQPLVAGARWIDVTTLQECSPQLPTVAMNAAHEVFIATPQLVPASQRTVHECMSSCYGHCGHPPSPVTVRAQVPADAKLVGPRMIKVPIDVAVSIDYATRNDCNVP